MTSHKESFTEYVMRRAVVLSQYGTCDRLKVGAVFFDDLEILGGGFNHQPGGKSCDDNGHILNDRGGCVGTIHAEMDALISAVSAGYGQRLFGSNLCATHAPCYYCSKIMVDLKLSTVHYIHDYDSKSSYGSGIDLLKSNGIRVVQWT